MSHSHSHDAGVGHSHDALDNHGHSHEILDGPGSYLNREMPLIEGRDWKDRAFTIGIGGYVADDPYLWEHANSNAQARRIRQDRIDAGVVPCAP